MWSFVNRVAFCAQYSIEQSRMRWTGCVVHMVGTWLQAARNVVLAYVLVCPRSSNFNRVSASRQPGLVEMCHGIPDIKLRQPFWIINCGVARLQTEESFLNSV
jgi:hypothetical protein